MLSRLTSRLRDRRGLLRASIRSCMEALESRQLLTATANPGGPPNAPFNLTATATEPTVARFSFIDSADNETGFVIRRAAAGSGTFTDLATLAPSTAFHATLTYSDTTVVPGTTYAYEAVALNGPYSSSTPAPVSVTTPTSSDGTTSNPGGAPNAPFGLIASPHASFGITFAFYDSATNETGFVIERATSASGPFTTLDTIGPSPGTGQLVRYEDLSQTQRIPYYYRVYAVNGIYRSSTPAAVIGIPQNVQPPPSGTLHFDASFGSGGEIGDATAVEANALAVTVDGARVFMLANALRFTTGYVGPVVDAYTSIGERDVNFANGQLDVNAQLPRPIATVAGIAVQDDGKLIVAGNAGSSIAIARFNTDGSLDTSFGNASGEFLVDYNSGEKVAGVAIARNGQIYIGGSHAVYQQQTQEFFAIRVNADGTLDRSFGYNGISKGGSAYIVSATAIALDPLDGSAIVVGGFVGDVTIANPIAGVRLSPNGSATSTYGAGLGLGAGNIARDAIVDAKGKVVLVGTDEGSAIAQRLNPDGTSDPTWVGPSAILPGTTGRTLFDSIVQLTDGSYLVVGEYDVPSTNASPDTVDALVVRLRPDGSIDPRTGGDNGVILRDLPQGAGFSNVFYNSIAIAPLSAIYAGGGDHGTLLLSKFRVM